MPLKAAVVAVYLTIGDNMPLKTCSKDGKSGYQWGDAGVCYTYNSNDPASKVKAKKAAIKQGLAIEGPDKFKEKMKAEFHDDILELIDEELLILKDIVYEINIERRSR